ncbi:hypothetical protein [Quadrisphaera sp. INWT6]|uniref:hypothetical protein n=1 Tax=Quadrisphaera sp. INWT6 TaxID=2596917 RepID=UPI00189248F9|nr:hypothetical protein [Quadrisphaera sp. INWT6]MBF5082157.1 hypothetical protein [Quadrisphaera sp. INWT6]
MPDPAHDDEWDVDESPSPGHPSTPGSATTDGAVPALSTTATAGRRRGHSPWALPVLVAVITALIGGAGLRAARSAATHDLQLAEQLASLRVGTTQVLQGTDNLQRDAQGRLVVPLQAEVRNDGDAPVTVTVLATSTQHAVLASAQALPALAGGASGQLQWTVAVDCSAVPSAADNTAALNQALRISTTSPTQWLDLRVATDDQTGDDVTQQDRQQGQGQGQDQGQTRRYFTADAPGSDVAYLLPFACDPTAVPGG